MLRKKDLDLWFDKNCHAADVSEMNDPVSYIHSKADMLTLPDKSRSLNDMIGINAARTSSSGTYDIYVGNSPFFHSDGFRFQIEDGYRTEVHSHNYVELALVIRGTMHIGFDYEEQIFRAGEMCMIRRGLLHTDILRCDDSILLYLGISDKFFDKAFLTDSELSSDFFLRRLISRRKQEHDFIRFFPRNTDVTIPGLFLAVLDEISNQRPGGADLIRGLCKRILWRIPSEYQLSLSNVEHSEYQYYVYQDVITYIKSHFDSVTTDELSRVFGYNPDYFNRLIRRFAGTTYSDLLQSTRIEAAASLLTGTDLSIEEIATKVGCSNLGLFYRNFKSTYRCTPHQFRKREH